MSQQREVRSMRLCVWRVLVLAGVLALGGCGTVGDVVSRVGAGIAQGVPNPITQVDIYRVRNTYAASLEAAAAWRTYCYARPYAVLIRDPIARPICQDRRSVIRRLQDARPRVASAVRIADDFVTRNPTLDASTALRTAWDAIAWMQGMIPQAQGVR